MKPPLWVVVVLAGALVGVVFAGFSTYDFVQHLDRQEHGLHCSFIPGAATETGTGCQVAMMSEYSSVFRSHIWGGVPISLPAMAVFAFIGFFAIDLLITRRKHDPRATAFLAAATALPVLASLSMLVISLTQLGTTCTMCVAIYAASAICFTGALVLWRRAVRLRGAGDSPDTARASGATARRASGHANTEPAFAGARGESAFAGARSDEPAFAATARDRAEPATLGADGPATDGTAAAEAPPDTRVRPLGAPTADTPTSFLASAFAIGVAFVAVPVFIYFLMAPDHGRFVGTCDGLSNPDDTYGVMVRVGPPSSGGVPAIEVLDPLCPACKAFEKQLDASGYRDQLARKAILFPLDKTCNWMLTEVTHPGACTVSEAVLCAGDRSHEVIAWAFDEQERILAAAKQDPKAAARLVSERFPNLASCIGSPEAKSKLNKSLRWAVANDMVVRTPQLFIGGVKLCDADVDLGLAYSLRIMLERYAEKTLGVPATPSWLGPVHVPAPDNSGTPRGGADRASEGGTDKPSGTGTDKPSGTATDKPSGTGTDKPSGTATDKPSGTGTDKPSGTGADKPSGTGTDKPSGTGTSKPSGTDAPADKPVTSPSETPATEPPPAAPAPAAPAPSAPEGNP